MNSSSLPALEEAEVHEGELSSHQGDATQGEGEAAQCKKDS